MENPAVSSVTHDPNIVIFKLSPVPQGPQFLSDLFRQLAAKGVVVDIITQNRREDGGGQRLAFSVSREDLPLARGVVDGLVKETPAEVSLMEDVAKISVVGVGMRNHPGVAARFFEVLNRNDIDVHLVTTSEIKISAVIDKKLLPVAAESLHSEFNLDR